MGIDYGSKRVGVALTNESGDMAFPREVLKNDKQLIGAIVDIAETEQVSKIIVGHSVNVSGEENPLQSKITEFIGNLTAHLGIPIELESEHYTTQEALRIQGRNSETDASAAALILNSYITKTNRQ
jgi:putative Holliday junction resolvase